jgi:yersiniabactin nonribosomal peptide synthetase
MRTLRLICVGNDGNMLSCIKYAQCLGHQLVKIISSDSDVIQFCSEHNVDCQPILDKVDDCDFVFYFDIKPSFNVIKSNIEAMICHCYSPSAKALTEGKDSATIYWLVNLLEPEPVCLLRYSCQVTKKNIANEYSDMFVSSFYELIALLSRHGSSTFSDLEYVTVEPPLNQTEVFYSNYFTSQLQIEKENQQGNLVSLLESQVEKHPNAIALIDNDCELTYKQLSNQINLLSGVIREKLVLKALHGKEPLIAICLPRGHKMISAIFAILKSAGAYLPLDPSQPYSRIKHIVDDAKPLYIITTEAFSQEVLFNKKLKQELILIDTLDFSRQAMDYQAEIIAPEQLAYVLYTSGSTGKPKGVMVEHQQVVSSTTARFIEYKKQPGVFLLLSDIAYDSSVAGIFWTLSAGGTLVIPNTNKLRDLTEICALINKYSVTHLLTIPSYYQEIVECAKHSLNSLNTVIVAGESCSLKLSNLHHKYLPGCALVNEYGPTEATVWTSYAYLNPEENHIGKPIKNTWFYVLNEQLEIQPPGKSGELFISGKGIARGYLNQPSLTKQYFIANPFSNSITSKRLYKTGDYVRYRQDGKFEFLGRKDDQIKIRGYRVELSEIEMALLNHDDVNQAVVISSNHIEGSPSIVACYVGGEFKVTTVELNYYLDERLPDYMRPKYYLCLDKIPLLSNGKVDKNALREIFIKQTAPEKKASTPCNDIERSLMKLWKEVLAVDEMGTDDNFLELGGNSLVAVRLIQSINRQFNTQIKVSDLINYSTISSLSKLMVSQNHNVEALPEIITDWDNRYQPFSLTSVQTAYWLGRKNIFTLGNVSTHIYYELDFHHLNITQLEKALNKLINRHEMLRAIVTSEGKQRVLSAVPYYSILLQDLSKSDNANELAEQWRKLLSHQMLDCTQWPLFDIRVSQFEEKSRLHFSLDALLYDAFSVQLFLIEWQALYNKPDRNLPDLTLSFRDYLHSYHSYLSTSKKYQNAKLYWLNRIKNMPLGPELPLLNDPSSIKQPRFKRLSKPIPEVKWTAFKKQALSHQVSLNSALLTVFSLVLQRWSKNDEFLINLTLFNRLPVHKQVDEIMGDFTQLELLEFGVTGKIDSFLSCAKKVNQQLWQDLEHSVFDGVEVQREMLRIHGTDIVGRIAPVVFTSFLNWRGATSHVAVFENDNFIEEAYSISQTSQTWLDHKAYEHDKQFVTEWDYIEDLFDEELISIMHDAYYRLILHLSDNDWTLALPDLLPKQQQHLFSQINHTGKEYVNQCLHEPFLQQAKFNPKAIALVQGNEKIGYGLLAKKASEIANTLCLHKLNPEQPIAIYLEKSWLQIASCLGVLQAGGIYLPLNSKWPIARVKAILSQSDTRIIITQQALVEQFDSVTEPYQCLTIDDEFQWIAGDNHRLVSPSQIAYIIYTSGSTGMPKGVAISHQSAMNTINAINQEYRVCSEDRVLMVSDLSFDLSVYDIFGLLTVGGTVVIVDNEEPADWMALIAKHNISIWNSVPMFMQLFLAQPINCHLLVSIRLILLSGDWIGLDLVAKIKETMEKGQLIGLGGATEASIWSIWYSINGVDPKWSSIPYGYAMPNQQMYVLNKQLDYSPVGVVGDIYIGGKGLAKGYWKDECKTKSKFIIHPKAKQRLYQTGDIGRYLSDGSIEFLGREDTQVKLGGYRIELGEIEATLTKIDSIKKAMVSVESNNEKTYLIAYVIPESMPNHSLDYTVKCKNQFIQSIGETLTADKSLQAASLTEHSELIAMQEFFKAYDEATPLIIYHSLISVGLFSNTEQYYPLKVIQEKIKVSPQYENLLVQWLDLLVNKAILIEHGLGYKIAISFADESYVIARNRIETKYLTNQNSLKIIYEYLERCSQKLIPLLSGDVNPLEIFMPNANLSTLNYLYRDNPAANYYNLMVRSIVLSYLDEFKSNQTCNLLELGAGIGATTEAMVSALASYNVSYTYTDITSFFIDYASKLFSEYDYMNYDIFDINIDPAFQGYSMNHFDIIIAANVLHNAKNIDASISHLKSMLKPNGIVILIEATNDTSLQLINLSFLEGVVQYDDERSVTNKTLLNKEQWLSVFEKNKFSNTTVFPDKPLMVEGNPLHHFLEHYVIISQVSNEHNNYNSDAIKAHMKQELPHYMLPQDYIFLAKWPLTANGKIDRKLLTKASSTQKEMKVRTNHQRNAIEQQLYELWVELLKTDGFSVEDNFFQLGGDSIIAIQLISRAREKGFELNIKQLYLSPTIAQLASSLKVEDVTASTERRQ